MLQLFPPKRLALILLVLPLFLIAARPLQAPSGDITVFIQLALAAFTALVGWPALLSVLAIAAQYWGWITAAAAETFMFWANVLVFGGILVLALLGKIDLVNQIDATFGNLAKLLTYVLIILGVPLAFERSKTTEEKFRATRMFQLHAVRQNK
jgi:hypothetical protein